MPGSYFQKTIQQPGSYFKLGEIRKITKYLQEFFKTEGKAAFLIPFIFFLSGSIYFNYTTGLGEKLNRLQGTPVHLVFSFIFYAIPYLFTILLYAVVCRKKDFLLNYRYWLLAIFAISILAVNESFVWYRIPVKEFLPEQVHYLSNKTASKFSAALINFLPVFLFWHFTGRKDKSMYGCTVTDFDYRTYLVMLLAMVPLIAWASYQQAFLTTYPVYRSGSAEAFLGTSNLLSYSVFELIYGLNFASLEFFFRGFLIFAFVKYLDKGAIFAMVSVYCYLHFQKPLPEAIGSVFGGAILGIVSYYSRSIFGGIIIHIGVAYLMDLFAGLQHISIYK